MPFPLILGLATLQGIVLLGEEAERRLASREARAYAKAQNKPMLVVGGPFGSNSLRQVFYMPAHECGDTCVDLDPKACEGCRNSIVADVRQIPVPNGYFASALCSHVLEHLSSKEDALLAYSELNRVAERVWVVSPSKLSLFAWAIPSHHLWVSQTAEGKLIIEQR